MAETGYPACKSAINWPGALPPANSFYPFAAIDRAVEIFYDRMYLFLNFV